MPDLSIEPPWWVVLIIGAILPELYKACIKAAPKIMTSTKGATNCILKFLRYKRLKSLKKDRFDKLKITKQISRSNAYLVIFIICALAYLGGLPLSNHLLDGSSNEYALMKTLGGVPGIFFELCWLSTSSRVNSLIRLHNKIKLNSGRAIRGLEQSNRVRLMKKLVTSTIIAELRNNHHIKSISISSITDASPFEGSAVAIMRNGDVHSIEFEIGEFHNGELLNVELKSSRVRSPRRLY